MMTKCAAWIGVVLSLVVTADRAAGQCNMDWLPGEPLAGLNGAVFAITSWDPDGVGGVDPWLVVGGDFTIAGDVAANRVAGWDGTTWHAMGAGVPATVRALASYNGDLYVGTDKITFQNPLHRWNGTSWQIFPATPNNHVYALTVFGGALIVGGEFTQIGGLATGGIASWNGVSWSALASGLGPGPRVRAMAEHGGDLFVGGANFGGAPAGFNIRRWDGAVFNFVGTGVNSEVFALASFGANLVAGGTFTNAGGTAVNRIAQWNGVSWSALAAGVSGGISPRVLCLTVCNSDLLVGGQFTTAGTNSADNVARWRPLAIIQWLPAGDGLNSSVNALHVQAATPTLCAAGGSFTASGDTVSRSLAWYDGNKWSNNLAPGIDNWVQAFGEYGGSLVAGGSFRVIGGTTASRVAAWDGAAWLPFGSGVGAGTDFVRAVQEYSGDLFVGGLISEAGGTPVANVARWNGANWNAMGGGLTAGFGTPIVRAMVEYQGDLIVGGFFTLADGSPANSIARWDGGAWHAMGGGLTGGATFPTVRALAVYAGELYAGGDFAQADGNAAPRIARWNGAGWQDVGGGVTIGIGTATVDAMVVWDGSLIVGGNFDNAGGVGVSHIARWNGTTFSSLGVATNGVTALALLGGELHMGGHFFSSGPNTIPYAARYTGAGWDGLGSGLNAAPFAMAGFDGVMTFGGSFTEAGGDVSNYIARWASTCDLGDLNCDMAVTTADTPLFSATLLDPGAADFCERLISDINGDGTVNGGDVGGFVDCLLAGNCP